MPGARAIKHNILNAKPENVERESEIVAQSGRKSAVTISTNMAGRGTDILLGGNAEYMARLKLREYLMPEVVSPLEEDDNPRMKTKDGKPRIRNWMANPSLFPCELTPETVKAAKKAAEAAVQGWGRWSLPALEAEDRLSVACEKGFSDDPVILELRAVHQSMYRQYKQVTDTEKVEVVSSGGLHVVGTERHESRRVDNQLRGRSGRQGDPGSTRFFLSLEDNLFRVFGGDKIKGMMTAFQVEDLPMESQMLTDALDTAQKKVENYFFDIRKEPGSLRLVSHGEEDEIPFIGRTPSGRAVQGSKRFQMRKMERMCRQFAQPEGSEPSGIGVSRWLQENVAVPPQLQSDPLDPLTSIGMIFASEEGCTERTASLERSKHLQHQEHQDAPELQEVDPNPMSRRGIRRGWMQRGLNGLEERENQDAVATDGPQNQRALSRSGHLDRALAIPSTDPVTMGLISEVDLVDDEGVCNHLDSLLPDDIPSSLLLDDLLNDDEDILNDLLNG
eukprot:gene23574-9099_t